MFDDYVGLHVLDYVGLCSRLCELLHALIMLDYMLDNVGLCKIMLAKTIRLCLKIMSRIMFKDNVS